MEAGHEIRVSTSVKLAVTATGTFVAVPSWARVIRVYVEGAHVWLRTGDATLVGTDVQTDTQSTTAQDYLVPNGLLDYSMIVAPETIGRIGLRTATGTTANAWVSFVIPRYRR